MKQDKMQRLFKIIPFGAIVTTKWLKESGYTSADLQQYTKNGWIKSLGYGVYQRHDCDTSKLGAIYGLQQNYDHQFWLGGLSALELLGAAHYIRNAERSETYLYTNDNKLALPNWLRKYGNYNWKLIYNTALNNQLAIEDYDARQFSIKISSRERALLEFIYNVPKYHGFNEANYLVENSSSFRPDLMQLLLEQCSSIKTKRIVLFLAEKNNLSWFNDLDLGKITLGSGEREIVKNGLFNPKYKITYPKDLFEDDRIAF
jgi:hypothetical protein